MAQIKTTVAIIFCISVLITGNLADFSFLNGRDSNLGAFGNSLIKPTSQPSTVDKSAATISSPSSLLLLGVHGGNGYRSGQSIVSDNLNIPNSFSGDPSQNNSTIPKSNSLLDYINNSNNNDDNNSVFNKRCTQRSSRDFRPHPADCSKFTLCLNGILVEMACPSWSVFHTGTSTCVPRGSIFDLCSTRNRQQTPCAPGSTSKVADPTNCARYFHCGQPAQEYRWKANEQECPYPTLFNTNTLRCEHYTDVDCGARTEPMDPCEYKANTCGFSARCPPCSVRFPACRGRPDGINAWEGRPNTPDYVVCTSQRVAYHGTCLQTGNGVQVFDEVSGGCVLRKS